MASTSPGKQVGLLSRQPIIYVLLAGLVAAALDIIFAMSFWFLKGVEPIAVLQSIAAGVLGAKAFEGGFNAALLGLLLHFIIAFGMAYTYFFVSHYWLSLAKRPIFYGSLYGLLLYFIMNFVIVPLSATAPMPAFEFSLWVSLSIIAHMFLVGIPCALGTRYARRSLPTGIRTENENI